MRAWVPCQSVAARFFKQAIDEEVELCGAHVHGSTQISTSIPSCTCGNTAAP